MEIITTHVHADFDALASMAAARRLHPGASLVLSGDAQRQVRDFLEQEAPAGLSLVRPRDVDLGRVSRLILVDTRQRQRLGPLAACLDNPGIEVYVYDHHPPSPDDVEAQELVVEPLGATVTVLAGLLRERGVCLDRDEATLLALGLYEDTGSFHYPATTPTDLETGAWLIAQGADLDLVSRHVQHGLTARELRLLQDFQRAATLYAIQDSQICVTTPTLDEYTEDLARLVRRYMIMENLDAVFAIIRMGSRLQLIARSRTPAVNAGLIARGMGGGGHAEAAAATIREATQFEAEERLVLLLHQHIRPRAMVREIMSSPVRTITPDAAIQSAADQLTRYNFTVLPVVDPQAPPPGVVGLVSRQQTARAMAHGFGSHPVSEVMDRDPACLDCQASLADIQRIIIEHRQRVIPIVEQNELAGIITRTDLLNLLARDIQVTGPGPVHDPHLPSARQGRNVADTMAAALDRETMVLLRRIGELASSRGCKAYVAGGFVRDLLLGTPNLDIDIVVEENGIRFAKALARELGARVHTHEKFMTATLVLPDGLKIDVATARSEYYEYPAAMPVVEFSSIKLDLYRRDFTINAMAIHLSPEGFGTLVDHFNGLNDLNNRRIRVLHNLSFVDDPTRIFRAIRFEQRLGFGIIRSVERLIRHAVEARLYDRCEGRRFYSELQHILAEENPLPCLRRMAAFHLFPLLWSGLPLPARPGREFWQLLNQVHGAISWRRRLYIAPPCRPWAVYLGAIFGLGGQRVLDEFCQRFEVPIRDQDLLRQVLRETDRAEDDLRDAADGLKPSLIHRILSGLENESLLLLMARARDEDLRQAVSLYVTRLRDTRPLLDGHMLRQAGYRPGPLFSSLLREALEAQLDGLVSTPEEALEFLLQRHPPETAQANDSDRSS